MKETLTLEVPGVVNKLALLVFFIEPLASFLQRHELGAIEWADGEDHDYPILGMLSLRIPQMEDTVVWCYFWPDGKAELMHGEPMTEFRPDVTLSPHYYTDWLGACRWIVEFYQHDAVLREVGSEVLEKFRLAGDALGS
jgi:hypothetical protein